MPLHAQNQLVPAEGAVKLRRVWTMIGDDVEGKNRIGQEVGGLPDINNDSIADFVVRTPSGLLLFLGSRGQISSEPYKVIRDGSLIARTPIVGDFWGDGRLSIGIGMSYDGPGGNYVDVLQLFALDSGVTLSEKRAELDPFRTLDPPVLYSQPTVAVMEIDGRAGDELTLVEERLYRGDSLYETAEVWFYLGGPDFQLDSHSVLIRDTGLFGPPSNFSARFADLDGDRRVDMVMSGTYPGVGEMLRFYWGDDDSPASWSRRPPDRDVRLVHGQIGINDLLSANFGDFDGDGITDLASQEYEDVAGVRVYLSSSGKNVRTRSFDLADADVTYSEDYSLSRWRVGPLNDSLQRFDMLPVGGTISPGQTARFLVSGGSLGPDHDYEAWYAPGLDGLFNEFVFNVGAAVGDITSDGWPDLLYGAPNYGIAQQGIAFVLAGGPEIPLDDPSMAVEEYPVAGESGGLYLWPNPVEDELHIAWRGNLRLMPARFKIFELNGELIIESDADAHHGEMLWKCAGVAAGIYLLIVYDNDNNRIADARIIKR